MKTSKLDYVVGLITKHPCTHRTAQERSDRGQEKAAESRQRGQRCGHEPREGTSRGQETWERSLACGLAAQEIPRRILMSDFRPSGWKEQPSSDLRYTVCSNFLWQPLPGYHLPVWVLSLKKKIANLIYVQNTSLQSICWLFRTGADI